MNHPGASHKSISIADQSTTFGKAARHVMLVLSAKGRSMRRRELITLLTGAAVAWPLSAGAQQSSKQRRIGVLMTIAASDPEAQARLNALREGLAARKWIEGQNIQIDYRFASGAPERVRSAAAELVNLKPDLLIANGRAILAALRDETKTIPIVFVLVPDPIADGFVSSLAHPAGNITGITNFEYGMAGKWVDLLNEVAPRRSKFTFLFNPDTAPYAPKFQKAISSNFESALAPVSNNTEIENALEKTSSNEGLIIVPDLFTSGRSELIIKLSAQRRVPTIYPFRFFVDRGGLLSYGVDTLDLFRRTAIYVDQIFNGEKPGALPVQAPVKFELAVNLVTAKALGLDIPAQLLARADEVIE
jgi:putative ABC transport system substrate-binding protein